jgi:hypothetical protein
MVLRGRSARELLVDVVGPMRRAFKGGDVLWWFQKNCPAVKANIVTARIAAATVNSQSAHHYRGQQYQLLVPTQRSPPRTLRRHSSWQGGRLRQSESLIRP